MIAPSGKVSADQRYTAARPCPICGGHEGLPRGRGERCTGYLAASGKSAFCERRESDEAVESATGTLYRHRLGHADRHDRPRPSANGKPKGKGPGHETLRGAALSYAQWSRTEKGVDLGELAGEWVYEGPDGKPHMAACRFEAADGGKTYRPFHRGADRRWRSGDPEGPLPLYRLPTLAEADLVVVCEGEKAADAVRSLGLVATTPAHGAKNPHLSDLTPLAGKSVVILPDNDEPGRKFAEKVVEMLSALDPRPTVRVVELPGLPPKGDAAEWIAGGGTRADLLGLIEAADPVEAIDLGMGAAEARPEFTNYVLVPGNGDGDRPRKEAIDQPEVLAALDRLTGGWPKRVGGALFAHDGTDAEPITITGADQLFAWLGGKARIAWSDGASFVGQRRLHEALKMGADSFEAIERHPHFPPVQGVYYAHSPVVVGRADGSALERLLDLFCPATDADRELIRAFVLTLFWGGPAGKRPMFLAEGPEDDPLGGRGVGKSDLFGILAGLVGGAFSNISTRDDISAITKRIINDKSRKRCVLFDNVKSERFSWAELEGMITGPTIGGHLMYVGDEARPNLLTYCMTINGASLSEDLAQRTVMIRLDRPKSYDRDGEAWSDAAARFVAENRAAIIADVAATFGRPAVEIKSMQRWASWTHGVLARCNDPFRVQNVIVERQDGINDDRAASDEFGRFLAPKIEAQFRRPAAALVAWIRSEALVPIVAEFTGERITPLNVSKKINRFRPRELAKRDRKDSKGWLWTGSDADPASRPVEWIFPAARPADSPASGDRW